MTAASHETPTARRNVRRRSRRSTGSKRRRTVLIVIGVVLLVLLAAAAWVGIRALLVKQDLEQVVPLTSSLKQAVTEQDQAAVARDSSELSSRASSAASLSGDPIWRAAEVIPFIGPNLTAVREIAQVADDLASKAVAPLARIATEVKAEDFKPQNGAIDVAPLEAARVPVSGAQVALTNAQKSVAAIDTSGTIGQVTSAVDQIEGELDALVPTVTALDNAVQLLPSMLGADGPKQYLLLIQNPAELRSGGGIPGALALLKTDGGKLTLEQQASSADFPRFQQPILPLPAETQGLYGSIVGEYIQNVTLTPKFSLSGELAQAMWQQRYGTTVDGVISVDPVTLSYLLGATGPVDLVTGDQLTQENAVSLLLSEVYARYPLPAQQDLFFAAAAKAVFDKVSAGDIDPIKLVDALTRAGSERRIMVWNADEQSRDVLAGTTLAGDLPAYSDERTGLGLYFNDGTGAKMDYYLTADTQVGSLVCRQDGKPYQVVQVTVKNNAPADAGTSLPEYVTAGGAYGVSPGSVKTFVSAYGSPGLVNLGVMRDGASVSALSTSDDGYGVTQIPVQLAPGESTTLTFGYLAPSSQSTIGEFQRTPIVNMNETSELSLSCESALW